MQPMTASDTREQTGHDRRHEAHCGPSDGDHAQRSRENDSGSGDRPFRGHEVHRPTLCSAIAVAPLRPAAVVAATARTTAGRCWPEPRATSADATISTSARTADSSADVVGHGGPLNKAASAATAPKPTAIPEDA